MKSDLELRSHWLAPSRSGSFSSAISMTCCCKTSDTSLKISIDQNIKMLEKIWKNTWKYFVSPFSRVYVDLSSALVAHLAPYFLSIPCSLEASCRSPCAKRLSPGAVRCESATMTSRKRGAPSKELTGMFHLLAMSSATLVPVKLHVQWEPTC